MTEPVRLHKLLARMGVASLRASERLISEGRVSVNGAVVTAPGVVAMPEDNIEVDGRPLTRRATRRYFLVNKPEGVLSTTHDERGRRTVVDLLPVRERLYPVGRLDLDSQGLMLITDDGELANRLQHPRYGVHKEYEVEVQGPFTNADLARLRRGVELEDGPSRPLRARVLRHTPDRSALSVTMGEGRKRQIRRTLEALGFRTLRLTRIRLGDLRLDSLQPAEYRELSPSDARALRRAVGLDPVEPGS